MKVLVTGGTGFIGKHLLKALVSQGYKVEVLVRKTEDQEKVKKFGAKAILGNLGDLKSLRKIVSRVDICYHLAAIRNDWGYSWKDYSQDNVEATRNLLTALSGQLKHFIFISSVKASHPTTLYGKSKLQAEKIVLEFFSKKSLPLTIIRPAIVYGPEDSYSGMMPKLIRLIKNGRFLMVGDGENRLHLVYINDLVQAFLLAAKRLGQGKIYTIASEKPLKLKDLVNLISNELKVKILPLKIPIVFAKITGMILEKIYPLLSKNEPLVTRNKVETITGDHIYDISYAKKELGFSPQVDYPEGIKKTINWYKQVFTS